MRDPWQEGMQGDGTSRGTYSSPGAQFAVFECARDSFNKISRWGRKSRKYISIWKVESTWLSAQSVMKAAVEGNMHIL